MKRLQDAAAEQRGVAENEMAFFRQRQWNDVAGTAGFGDEKFGYQVREQHQHHANKPSLKGYFRLQKARQQLAHAVRQAVRRSLLQGDALIIIKIGTKNFCDVCARLASGSSHQGPHHQGGGRRMQTPPMGPISCVAAPTAGERGKEHV